MGMAACAQLALVPLALSCLPRWWPRRTLQPGSRPLPWSMILQGATLMDALLTTRLTSAPQDAERARGPYEGADLWRRRGRYRRERWAAPSGETALAPLPTCIVGGFGPELRCFLRRGVEWLRKGC